LKRGAELFDIVFVIILSMESSSQAVQKSAGQVGTENLKTNVNTAALSVRKASYWFFGIAAFSIINTLLVSRGMNFSVGLSLNKFVGDVVTQSSGETSYITDIVAAGVFIVLGFFSIRIQRWAFIAGLIIYLVDALIYIVFEEWVALALHGYILYRLFLGLRALATYDVLKTKIVSPSKTI
jgi:hypothetical protein